MNSDSPQVLIWQLLRTQLRRYRTAVGATYASALGLALATLVWPDVFFVSIFALGIHSLAVYYAAGSLLRSATTSGVVREMLLTPVPSSAYGHAFRKLFAWYFLAQLLVLGLAIAGLPKSQPHDFRDNLHFLLYLVPAGVSLFWSSIFGLKRILLVCAIPAALMIAILLYHLVIHENPGAHELKQSHIIGFIALTITWFLATAAYHVFRSNSRYADVLRSNSAQ